MAYNLDLEDRIDHLVDRFGEITKKNMFGGIGYLINGNTCFGIHKKSLVICTSPRQAEKLMRSEHITLFDITGRPMKGWVMVSPDVLKTDDQLVNMLRFGVSFTKNLSVK